MMMSVWFVRLVCFVFALVCYVLYRYDISLTRTAKLRATRIRTSHYAQAIKPIELSTNRTNNLDPEMARTAKHASDLTTSTGIYKLGSGSTSLVTSKISTTTLYKSLKTNKPKTLHYSNKTDTGNDNSKNKTLSRLKVGLLIPSTTRNMTNETYLMTSSLTTLCLPSVFETIEPSKYDYTIYIGIDKGDYLETLEEDIRAISKLIITVVVNSTNFNECVDGIAARAYADGMDYLVRINDDTVFVTSNWTTLAIRLLLSYTPPNVGVVGPSCGQGKTTILTHDMVHRTHLDIFDHYYPEEFTNWWADDWITLVYRPGRSSFVPGWRVVHKMKHGRRYRYQKFRKKRLDLMEKIDKPKIMAYLSENSSTSVNRNGTLVTKMGG